MPQIVSSAISYSGAEKRGVHTIAMDKRNVIIDMEIAFSKLRGPEPEDPARLDEANDHKRRRAKVTAPRMDLAALFADGQHKAHLVFYEVKRFEDGRLWGMKPPVLDQMQKYNAFLERKEPELKAAYENVCKLLSSFFPTRTLSSLISDVAHGLRTLEIDKASRLVVFDYDNDQKKGRLKELRTVLKEGGLVDNHLITRGNLKGLQLSR